MAVVDHKGNVIWMPPSIFKSTCEIDITNFPFDIQTCRMKFGSWTYDGSKLDIMLDDDPFALGDYVESKEWVLLHEKPIRNVKHYQGLELPYPDLTFFITIRRVAMFHSYILVLPCVLLSFLTLVIF